MSRIGSRNHEKSNTPKVDDNIRSHLHRQNHRITPEELSNEAERINFDTMLKARLYASKLHSSRDEVATNIQKQKRLVSYGNHNQREGKGTHKALHQSMPPITFKKKPPEDVDISAMVIRNSTESPEVPPPKFSADTTIPPPKLIKKPPQDEDLDLILNRSSSSSSNSGSKKNPFSFIEKVEKFPSAMEFVYLNRVTKDDTDAYNPYSLEITSHAGIQKDDYYTMSASGVTHFINGDADFTPLPHWKKEHNLFHKILNIPFFKQFRMWKTFYFMRQRVVKKRVMKANNSLRHRLFLVGETLTDSLIHIRKLCLEITSLKLFQDNSGLIMTLEEFSKLQDQQRMKTQTRLKEITTHMTDIVSAACKDFMVRAGFGDKFKDINEMNETDIVEQSNNLTTPQYHHGSKSQMPANVLRDEPYQMSYTELSQKRAACKRLMNFIRLVDYLILDSLILLNNKSVEEILKKVTFLSEKIDGVIQTVSDDDDPSMQIGSEESDSAPLFKTEIIVEEEELIIIPDKSLFDKRIDKVIRGFLDAIRVERLLTKKEFEEYLDPVLNDRGEEIKIGDGPNIKIVISREESYEDLVANIKETLNGGFKEVERYSQEFGSLLKMYLENKKMDIEAIHKQDPPLEFFSEEMKKYKRQNDAVAAMPVSKHKGLFFVDTKKLKNMFTPSPKNCLKAIHELLPKLAREKNNELLKEIKKAVQTLQTPPTTAEEFVHYLQYVEKMSVGIDEIELKFKNVHDIYALIDDEKVSVPPKDKEEFSNNTVSTISTLRAAIALAEDSKEDKINKFSADLERKFHDLRQGIQDVMEKANDPMIADEYADEDTIINAIQELQNTMVNTKERVRQLQQYQEMFKLDVSEIPEMEDVRIQVDLKLKLWKSLKEWGELVHKWKFTPFRAIDTDEISKNIDQYYFTAMQVQKGLPENPVGPKIMRMVEEWKLIYPVIQDLKNPSIRSKRLFKQLDDVIGKTLFTEKTEFDLGTLLELDIVNKRKEIEEISQQASNEASLEELLDTIKMHWEKIEFEVLNLENIIHRENQKVEGYILGSTEDIATQLEDDQITVGTILSSNYVAPIKEDVQKWEEDLRVMYETLSQWRICQQKWLYLESVFSGSDILSQLKSDQPKLFASVDRFFKETMKRTAEIKNVRNSTLQPGLLDKFKAHNDNLEKLEKSLEKYLEEKRNAFARFYFLSNSDLLDILSKSKDPQAVEPHLEKIFQGIKSLHYEGQAIKAMVSKERETIALLNNVKGDGVIPRMKGLEATMVNTLVHLTKQALKDYVQQSREEWILTHACQIVLTVSQIFWCREVTQCLESENPSKSLKSYLETCKQQLNQLAALTRTKLDKIARSTICTLIIIDVHARDVLEQMISEDVSSPTDFGWLKQLRYYWDEGGSGNQCYVRQSNSEFKYGYEYFGCQGRLVITPLTDRVYMTLTGALYLNLGGAPSGPAGTGKTESVKDLAKALAVQCIVYNCSEGVTYEMMYKFFSGIVQTGAWACFDEFNRINVEVLSVIASQLQTIQDALRAKKERFMLEDDKEIDLRSSCGVFITMNPGYAGRTELPDNLKALFRPVAVMIPDYGLISEVILFSEGYENAKSLSRKMVQLYKLSNEQLSSQDHYDFGMRAMKSVLVMAGELKRAHTSQLEDITLMKAMKDSNIPKFVADDVTLFEAIVSDLFPNIDVPVQVNEQLEEAIVQKLNENGLDPVPRFVTKILQFFDTMVVRHGVMLVGPTGSGKSTNRNILAEVMTHLCKQKNYARIVHQLVLNPKSITYGELYGTFNLDTHEWYDGLIPHFARKAVDSGKDSNDKMKAEDDKWLVFDGPVDTLWIESMNSVLDDSKLLCLDNTDRIQINDRVHFVFEVQDLAVASPATVSRCGMVYMDPKELGWKPFIKKWMKTKLPEALKGHEEILDALFEEYVTKGLQFVRATCTEAVTSIDLNLVSSLCNLITALTRNQDLGRFNDTINELIENIFIFAYVWSMGANIIVDSRQNFDKFVRELFKKRCNIPPFGSVYDFYLDFDTNTFVNWDQQVEEFVYSPSVPYFQLMVPTVDTVRYAYLLKILSTAKIPVLFNGKTGVGKTAIISNIFTKEKEKLKLELVSIQFSAQTSSRRTQETIESKLVLRKNVLKPPPGKDLILFIDDLNMPQLEQFGASPPIELLRQLLEYGGFFDISDRVNFPWKQVVDVTVVSACGPPGGGRNPTTPRLLRHFHLINIPDISNESMGRIFSSILNGFLHMFSDDIKALSKPLVTASVQLYNEVILGFRPTPKCAHYTFNLRDLSKVFQGILQVTPETVKQSQTFVKLWIHESMRCFYDRLINKEDREKFKETILLAAHHFKSVTLDEKEIFGENPLIFGDFMVENPIDRKYEQIKEFDKVQSELDSYMMAYNMKYTPKMDLIFFPDAAIHTSRIVRILRQQRGNALLVGVGGSGKQSLTRLAASILGFSIFEIKLKRGYGVSDFREDLTKLYKMAGVEGQQVVFLFNDSQIVNETFLEDINNILNCGEVPNLFEPADRETILNELRQKDQSELPETRDALYTYFINKVRDNLHIVLCMSPVGDGFRTRCRKFPSLVNCCTIDWFDEWPKEALLAVAERKLVRINVGSEDIKNNLTDLSVFVHSTANEMAQKFHAEMRRKFYITPASFLEFISFFTDYLDRKKLELSHNLDELKKGLSILKQTNSDVQVMQKEIEEAQPILRQKTREAEATSKEVEAIAKDVEKQQQIISEEEKTLNAKTQKANDIEREARTELDQALPLLTKAIKALDSIDKGDIAEIKKYKVVAEPIKLVLSAVLVLRGEKDTSWNSVVRVLGDPAFVTQCMTFDKDNIKPAIIEKLKKMIKDPNFDENVVGRSSNAAKSLCNWVTAMVKYSEVNKRIEPLKESLAKAKEEKDSLEATLAEKQKELAKCEAHVKELKLKFEKVQSEKKQLEESTALAQKRLTRAEKLTTSLADEYDRWTQSVSNLEHQITCLPGNIFIASACVVYYGAFNSAYRKQLAELWEIECRKRNIPMSKDIAIEKILSNSITVREWGIAGLPSDSHSTQNAVLVTLANKWPLLIDPQGQGNNWIKNMEKKNGLKIIKLSDSNYLRVLDNAIRIGTPVLIEDISETIDPALEPVLQKQIVKKQGKIVLLMGQAEVDYNPRFRLYMTTKLANPHYLPEICNKVTLINFTVTVKGLEDQLLADVVRKLEAKLEEEKDKIVVQNAEDMKMLEEFEKNILQNLSSVGDENILDNEAIIKTLDNSKFMANVIVERVKKAEETEVVLNERREEYRSVAVRGSILFFVLADLVKIDPMYQYSLEYFKRLFNSCISQRPQDIVETLKLLSYLIDSITRTVYTNVCRGLFEKDKLIYSFIICVQILRQEKKISEKDWEFFVRGLYEKPKKPNPYTWLSDKSWALVNSLAEKIPEFSLLRESIEKHPESWKLYCLTPEPYKKDLPDEYDKKITSFQKLLVIKCMREEKVLYASTEYVRNELGKEFTESPPLDLKQTLNATNATTPIIFVLSQGADPTELLKKFAVQEGYESRFFIKSLGQGQELAATKLIEKGRKYGDWILLQNCHLAVSFMPELERIVSEFSSPTAVLHADFRLWLTSMPSSDFPIPILQNGVKLTNEPPKGIRANIQRTYRDISEEFFESFSPEEKFPECEKRLAFKKLLFGLSMFHAIIQERKKFGPLGWTIKYEFNDSDLNVAKRWLQIFMKEQEQIPWDSLKYVIGQIVYGGRVTDPWDRRLILNILDHYFASNLLKQGFKFSSNEKYTIPHNGSLLDYGDFVSGLPLLDDPELFSMHENSNIVFQLEETTRMLTTISAMQPRSTSSSSGGDDQTKIQDMAKQILAELPENLDKSEAGPNTFIITSAGAPHSLSAVLSHEMLRFNKLLNNMRSTLEELLKALDGLVVLSAELEKMLLDMQNNCVPSIWSNHAYPSLKPLGSWIDDLYQRVAFMRKWLKHGLPKSFWLSGFFFPQGFLTGVLQTYARNHKVPIDQLSFSFKILEVQNAEDITEYPSEGVLVHGLYLDGAKWDAGNRTLVDADIGRMKYKLPVIHFLPTKDHSPSPDIYEAPLYKTSIRAGTLSSLGQSTNFIIAIEIPTLRPPSYWTLQGVACLTELTD